MKNKKVLGAIALIIFAVLVNLYIAGYSVSLSSAKVSIKVNMDIAQDDVYQMFYYQSEHTDGDTFTEENSIKISANASEESQTLSFDIPADTKYIRFDPGTQKAEATINSISIVYGNQSENIAKDMVLDTVEYKQLTLDDEDGVISITTKGEDPYLIWHSSTWNFEQITEAYNTSAMIIAVKIAACVIIDLFVLFMLLKIKKFAEFPKLIMNNRKLIKQLSRNDFKTRYAASFLGIFWAFLQPVVTVLVYWFVFEKGLKAGSQTIGDGISVPFVLFLVSGIVPWFFFNDALNGTTSSLTSYTYLVKKVVFNIDILPIVKVISALYVHIFFVAFSVCLFMVYGYKPDFHMLQLVYYTGALAVFVLGLGYLTSAIVVFFRDLSEIINIVLQIGVWITPVMWNIDTTIHSHALRIFFEANPLYYIVAGYRDSLINKVWFWERPVLTFYFWAITIVVFMAGRRIFKKLRVHFADVL